DTPGGVAVLVARCVSPAPASFVGRCRRHRAVDAPGGAAPSSGPFGAGGRGAAGVRWRGPGPPSSGRSGHAWRRGGVGGPVRLAGPGLLRRPVPSAPGRGRAWRRGPFFGPLRGRRPRGGRGSAGADRALLRRAERTPLAGRLFRSGSAGADRPGPSAPSGAVAGQHLAVEEGKTGRLRRAPYSQGVGARGELGPGGG